MKSQTRLMLMLPVLAIAGWLALFGDKTPVDSDVAVAAVRETAVDSSTSLVEPVQQEEVLAPGQIRRLASRAGMLVRGERGVDIFADAAAEAAPPPSSEPEDPSELPPPAQPFVFFGRILEEGRWRVFLELNGASYVLGVGDVAAGFRIDQISSSEVRLTRKADKFGFVIPIDGEKKD